MQAERPGAAWKTPRPRPIFPGVGLLVALLGAACTDEEALEQELDAVARARLEVAEAWELDGVSGPAADDALHALLARTYAEEALTRAYVDHHRALTRFAREEVSVHLEASVLEGAEMEGTVLEAVQGSDRVGRLRWRTRAEVRHAGHAHLRENRVEARVRWRLTDDGARIVEEEVLRAQRVPLVAGAREAGGRSLRQLLEEPVQGEVDTGGPEAGGAP